MRFLRVLAQPLAPIQPIAIVGAFVVTDLDVSCYRRVFVAGQGARPVAEGISRALALPVTLETPAGGFAPMAILRSLVQFVVDLAIYAGEGALGDTRAIVQRPAADDGVEGRDGGGLGRAPVVADDALDFIQVALNGLVARFDERLDARLPPEGVGVVLAHLILPDVEAEEVKPHLSLNDSASVAYGSYEDCLKTKEWTPLEPGFSEHKYYAPGIGLVLEIILKGGEGRVGLVDITTE